MKPQNHAKTQKKYNNAEMNDVESNMHQRSNRSTSTATNKQNRETQDEESTKGIDRKTEEDKGL